MLKLKSELATVRAELKYRIIIGFFTKGVGSLNQISSLLHYSALNGEGREGREGREEGWELAGHCTNLYL